ncbi:hypothetical protein M0802_008861 [Mischocyttarus mexicanus]|nr:hypothetical protein M0802_008861 [Mischocyttarus mexicanus]
MTRVDDGGSGRSLQLQDRETDLGDARNGQNPHLWVEYRFSETLSLSPMVEIIPVLGNTGYNLTDYGAPKLPGYGSITEDREWERKKEGRARKICWI